MRVKSMLAACASAAALVIALPEISAAQAQNIDVPAQPLPGALAELSAETGLQVLAPSELVSGRSSTSAAGRMTPLQALGTILSGTGLDYRTSDGGSVIVVPGSARASQLSNGNEELIGEDIIVTTRRFEENLQDVPGSVVAITGEELERSNIDSIDDYVLRLPNVNYIEGGSPDTYQISIRGLSNFVGASGSGPVNGIYVDEVILNPTGTNFGLDPRLFDLDRVEVAYGPQGTTFGRGAIGGAINFVTRKPSPDFAAEVTVEAGSRPDASASGFINGAILDDSLLSARASFYVDLSDGFIETPNLSEDQGLDTQDFGARIALRSQATDALTLDLSASYELNRYVDSNLIIADNFETDGPLIYPNNFGGSFEVSKFLTTLRADYDVGIGSIISTTSFSASKSEGVGDGDVSQRDALVSFASQETSSIGQEIRFVSDDLDTGFLGSFRVIAGGNVSWNKNENASTLTTGSDPLILFLSGGTTGVNTSASEQTIFNAAIFGDLTWEPTSGLEIGAGVRFNYDDVEFTRFAGSSTPNVAALLSAATPLNLQDSYTGISPKLSLRYEWTDDFSTYLLLSTGYRSGGFNAGPVPDDRRSFDEEYAINYEGGFKSTWLDGRLRVNASAFAIFYDDIQVFASIPTPTTPISLIENAAEARSIGGELSVQAEPVDGLFLAVDYGLTNAEFVSFPNSSLNPSDLSGQTLTNAPEHTLSIVGEYNYPVLSGTADLFLRGEYSYTSDYFNSIDDPQNDRSFGDRNIVNLRLGIRADNYELELFAENLFDEVYQTGDSSGFAANLFGEPRLGEVGESRRFGIRGTLRF